jgi:excisionase family DNA binding protein
VATVRVQKGEHQRARKRWGSAGGCRAADHITLADLEGCDFASVAEVAEVLRVDPRTVRRRIADGAYPATRIGSDWRVPTRWLREQAHAGTVAA